MNTCQRRYRKPRTSFEFGFGKTSQPHVEVGTMCVLLLLVI